jgi:hypothetical protein
VTFSLTCLGVTRGRQVTIGLILVGSGGGGGCATGGGIHVATSFSSVGDGEEGRGPYPRTCPS